MRRTRRPARWATLLGFGTVALCDLITACQSNTATNPGGALQGVPSGTAGSTVTAGVSPAAPLGAGGTVAMNTTGAAGVGFGFAGSAAASGGHIAAGDGAGRGGVGGAAGSAGRTEAAGSTASAGHSAAAGMGAVAGAAGNAGAGGSPAAACSGKPGMRRGKSTQMLMAAGLSRKFIYYAPNSLDANTPAPLVIVPHGYYMDADRMYVVTKFAELADKEKFIAVFPNGQDPSLTGNPWNIGPPNPTCIATVGFLPMATGDDQAFIDAMIKFADADQCVDHDHIFMAGFSMGAYFTNATGCLRDDIKAIAPHSGGSHDFSTCKVKSKPVLLLHFETDQLIPYMCGIEARDRWLKLNGCQSADPEVKMVKGGRCEYYKGCPANGQVAMCTFQTPPGGDELFAGHGWSGGTEYTPVVLSGYAIPETENATQLSWDFFKKYAW